MDIQQAEEGSGGDEKEYDDVCFGGYAEGFSPFDQLFGYLAAP
jgi:hypothetical protein